MTNSTRGPLNCNAYDPDLVAIDRKTPVAGSEVGLIHASTESAAVGESAVLEATWTREFVPENDAAVSVSAGSRLAAPSVTFAYVPAVPPETELAAGAPDVSSRR